MRRDAHRQLESIRDWDRYDLGVLDQVPDLIRDQLTTNARMAPAVIDAVCVTMTSRIELIHGIRNRLDPAL